jgi:hypothetical protein
MTAYAVALSTSSQVTVRLAFKYGASVLVLTTTFVGTPKTAEKLICGRIICTLIKTNMKDKPTRRNLFISLQGQ